MVSRRCGSGNAECGSLERDFQVSRLLFRGTEYVPVPTEQQMAGPGKGGCAMENGRARHGEWSGSPNDSNVSERAARRAASPEGVA